MSLTCGGPMGKLSGCTIQIGYKLLATEAVNIRSSQVKNGPFMACTIMQLCCLLP